MRPLIRSCFLLLVLGRLFLLALSFLLGICLRSRWGPPFPLHALARQGAALANLDSLSPLMIWYSGLRALFLFLLANAASAYLPTALSVALRALFPFQQAQYVQVFPLKRTPFCPLSADLGSTNNSTISLLFTYYLTLVLSSPPCRLLHCPLILNSVTDLARTTFSLLLYQTTMGPRTLVSPGARRGS